MTQRISNLYNLAVKDKQFQQEIYAADKDRLPGLFADKIEKTTIASIYYGWLVGNGKWRAFHEEEKLGQEEALKAINEGWKPDWEEMPY